VKGEGAVNGEGAVKGEGAIKGEGAMRCEGGMKGGCELKGNRLKNGEGGHGVRIALRRRFLRRHSWGWALALLWVAFGSVSAGAAEETEPLVIYQWTDSRGIYRYTPEFDRVPSDARDTVITIQTGEGPSSNTPIYFDPDPRSKLVEVPVPAPATGTARGVPQPDYTGYDDRIRELEAHIAEDEESLKELINDPGTASGEVTAELREIADRLPRLQAELDSLRRGRARSGKP